MILSIITINYNDSLGLEKTIKSVISQSYNNYEHIIIDGGSSDGSVEVLKKYADRIAFWISEPDKGIYNAMNKGIVRARGAYCHFLNSGDIYASDNVLLNVFEHKEYSESLLRGIQICDRKDGQIRWDNKGDREITVYDLVSDTLQHQATFIKRELFTKYGLYDEDYRIVSDWKFFLQTTLGDEKSKFLNIDLVIFDMNGISNNEKYRSLMNEERDRVLKSLLPKSILADYQRLEYLNKLKIYEQYEEYMYLPVFAAYHPVGRFCFRLIIKLYKLFKLA